MSRSGRPKQPRRNHEGAERHGRDFLARRGAQIAAPGGVPLRPEDAARWIKTHSKICSAGHSGGHGGPIILREQQIDLVGLRDVMEGFANFLGGVDGALDAAGSEGPW